MSLRREAMYDVHFGHFGEMKCIKSAKSFVYWPGCDAYVRKIWPAAQLAREKRHKNPALPLFFIRDSVHPFQMVSADIC